MKLTAAIGNEIMTRARSVLNREVLVADDRGMILAGNQPGAIMVEALRCCQEGRVIRSDFGNDTIAWCPFVYENHTIGAFGVIEDNLPVTPEAISLLQGLAEVIAHQHFLLEHIQPTEQMRANFLRQMLTSANLDASETFRQADILQISLRHPQAAMLVVAEETAAQAAGVSETTATPPPPTELQDKDKICRLAMEALAPAAGTLCCYLGNNQFVVLQGIEGEGLTTRNTTRYLAERANKLHATLTKALPKTVISIGVGQYYPDLGGLRKSYQEAKLSAQVGTKVWGSGRVYHIKQVGMFVTLANVAQERKAELAHQILHPLLRDEQLFKTVQTFLAAGLNLTEAAEKLHVHRNTLIYRLDKTRKVIGLDPRVFDDALQIKLGLMFYQEAAV